MQQVDMWTIVVQKGLLEWSCVAGDGIWARAESIEAFGRYSHAIRGQARKRKVQGEELEEMGDFIVGDLLATHLERLFPSFLRELTKLLTESGSSLFLGTIGGTSITTLAITSNYFAQPHLDLQDLGYAFLIWFVKDWPGARHVRSGGQFILPEYGLFILPEDGTILALSTSTVQHCTHVATGYDVIGMSLSAKKNVVQQASARTKDIIDYYDFQEKLRQEELLHEVEEGSTLGPCASQAIIPYVRRSKMNV